MFLGIGLAVIVLVFVGINFGGEFLGNLARSGSSEIALFVPAEGATVYIDGRKIATTDAAEKVIRIKDVTEGDHTVIVAKDGTWPWSKKYSMEGGKSVNGWVFLMPMSPKLTDIAPQTAEYATASRLLAGSKLPTQEAPLVSKDGNVSVWIDDTAVVAEWVTKGDPDSFFCTEDVCQKRKRVADLTVPVAGVSFYNDREDTLLFLAGGTVYAIEIDNKGGQQNFQPVLEQVDAFVPADDASVYVKQGASISKVAL